MPIALAPEPGWDQAGIWSGYVVKDDLGNVVAFYTGVDGVKAGIGLAYPDNELRNWTKEISNPLIPNPPSTYNHMDFRDPLIWKHDDKWFMIVGSGIHHVGGILLTYTSPDLLHWEVATPLFYDNYQNSGRFWEMPAFFKVTETKYILLVNTVPWDGVPAETIYWVGEWSGNRFKPDHEKPKQFDLINGPLLAPSINTDESGRITANGIIPDTRKSEDQNTAGWTHLYSLPRQLRLMLDGILAQTPHPNLCRLRNDQVENITDQDIAENVKDNLSNTIGDNLELHFSIIPGSAESFDIIVRRSNDNLEYTVIRFDEASNKVVLDQTHSSLSNSVAKNVKDANYVFSNTDTLDIRVFVDKSVIEVFVDNITSFSTRVYPTQSALSYDIVANGGQLKLAAMQSWTMDTTYHNDEICEPLALPNGYRKEIITGIEDQSMQNSTFTVFPNPSEGVLQILTNNNKQNIEEISVFDLNGGLLFFEECDLFSTGVTVDLKSLNKGTYVLEIKSQLNEFDHHRIIINR
jgi:beta-fructofuranosidase